MASLSQTATPNISAQARAVERRTEPATVRVGLWTLWRDREISVAPAGRAQMRRCAGCAAEPLTAAARVRAEGAALELNGRTGGAELLFSGTVELAAHGERLRLENPLRITVSEGALALTVTLPVESYVERVVASESGAADSQASLEALAVVVRSFALHVRHEHREYDLCDSTHCQLLHWGANGRAAAAHAATLATAGETLWFHGRRAEAWFSQNCGGRTAAPDEVWPRRERLPMPWLASHNDNACTAAGAREWSTTLSRAELTAALARAGLARPGWTTLTVVRRGASGRAAALRAGAEEFTAEDFRLAVGRALGWGRILSDGFEIAPVGSGFVFHGRGSGHGVGLCQAGAAAMASAGRSREQILAAYFHGAEAADESTGERWQRTAGEGFVFESLRGEDAAELPALRQALAEAEARSGLRPRSSITVRAFASTPAFRAATLAPGWVAGFTEGSWIGLQPLRTLAARGTLKNVLRHEFLHALIEQQVGAAAPLWLREGLAELWAGDADGSGPAPGIKTAELDATLRRATSEAESAAAHRAAAWYAARLIRRFGREPVLDWLRHGLPAGAVESVAGGR